MDAILANMIISVTELKRNFSNSLNAVQDTPVAVLNHNCFEQKKSWPNGFWHRVSRVRPCMV